MIDWSSLQKIAKGLSLEDLIKDEFKELLTDEFKSKVVEINSIQISVRDEKITSESTMEYVTLFHRDYTDNLLKKVVVDVTEEDYMNHITNVLKKWDE